MYVRVLLSSRETRYVRTSTEQQPQAIEKKKEWYRYYDTVLKHEKKITIIATTIILTALVISIHSITFYSSDFNQ